MKDNIWTVIYIILSCIVVMLVAWIMISSSRAALVDCDKLVENESDSIYKPLPKQCEEGEE